MRRAKRLLGPLLALAAAFWGGYGLTVLVSRALGEAMTRQAAALAGVELCAEKRRTP